MMMSKILIALLFIVIISIIFICYKYITYYIVIPDWLNKFILAIPVVVVLIFIGLEYKSKYHNVSELKSTMEFKSNQDSEYSQLWLDYLSFKDAEIGRLGSIAKFEAYLKSKGLSEKEYAIEVIHNMLIEQGVIDDNISIKCVDENYMEVISNE